MYKSLSKNCKNYKILPKELLFSINFISIQSNNTAEDLSRLIGCSGDLSFPIAIIRSFKNGKPFYIITNYNVKDINIYLKAYSRRWKIETIFRTCKQHLGLSDCQCLSKHKQNNYIGFVFLTYSLIQILRKKKRLKNSESLINRLKFKNLQYIFSELYSVYQLVHQF